MINSQISIVSALLQHPELAPEIKCISPEEIVNGGDNLPRLRDIYQSVLDLIELKIQPEPVLVAKNANVPIQIVKRLFENEDYVLDNLEVYIQEVRKETFRKELKKFGLDIVERADDDEITNEQLVFDISQNYNKLNKQNEGSLNGANFGAVLDQYLEKVEREKDLPLSELVLETPFADYNKLFSGYHYGDYTVIAGATGIGKTSYLMEIVGKALEDGLNVATFILEMNPDQIIQRQISKIAGLSMREIREYSFYKDSRKKYDFFEAINKLQQYRNQWFVFGSDTNSFVDIVNKIKQLDNIKPLSLVVIDYLQLASYPEYKNNRTLEIGFISQGFAALAKQLTKGHIIASAQLNRNNFNGQDKRPRLEHLKDSSLIEQSADGVEFLYRDSYFNEDSENPNVAELNRAKGRNTGTGKILLYWDGEHTSFKSLAPDYQHNQNALW